MFVDKGVLSADFCSGVVYKMFLRTYLLPCYRRPWRPKIQAANLHAQPRKT